MNKYQEYLFKGRPSENYFIFHRCCPIEDEIKGSSTSYGHYDYETDTFTVTQSTDINIVEYVLRIWKKAYPLEKVFIEKAGKWSEIEVTDSLENPNAAVYRIIVDFRNRTDKIRFCFKDGLADDYILSLKYIEADRDAYYTEQAKQAREKLLAAASVKHSTGSDLVNIYFQPCSEEYQRTEIILYHGENLLAQYKVDEGAFFKSIGSLAYGTYEYVVKQFGKDNKLLLETDKIKFSISAPHYGGRPTISW